MPQDGSKGPAQAKTRSSTGDSSATVLLTLCLSPSSVNRQHATVPYPASYEDACRKALNVFAAYLPAQTIAVALRRASTCADGTHIWSIVEEDDWELVIQRSGEEIGVFLPDNSAGAMPYTQESTITPKKFIHLYYEIHVARPGYRMQDVFEMMAVNSFEDCKLAAMNFLKATSTSQIALSFDKRMFGTADALGEYISFAFEQYVHRANWAVIHNVQTFDLLFERNPSPERPVSIKAQFFNL